MVFVHDCIKDVYREVVYAIDVVIEHSRLRKQSHSMNLVYGTGSSQTQTHMHTHIHTYAQGPISCFPQASSRPCYNLRLSLVRPNPNWYLMLSLNLRGQTTVCVWVCVRLCVCVYVCIGVCVCVSVRVLSQLCHRRYYQERAKREATDCTSMGVSCDNCWVAWVEDEWW